jgi:CRP-like cAMP-binding protein
MESALATAQNYLIAALPASDRDRLLAACQPSDLALSQVLSERGAESTNVWFPTIAFISLVSLVDGHTGVEVGMVGNEGMLGAHIALGVRTSPLRALVQGAGAAWRMSADDLHRQLTRSAALRSTMSRYLYVLMSQQATSAACLRFHHIEQRLARWLLMSQDRAHSDRFHVTQEFLACMLGVRRVGITVAASALQRDKVIEYRRGEVTVLDRARLEAGACSCYDVDRQTYLALL